MGGDTIFVSINGGIPANMDEGDLLCYFFLADPEARLHDRPDYAIRLANDNLWEDSTGYNSLNHQLKITVKCNWTKHILVKTISNCSTVYQKLNQKK